MRKQYIAYLTCFLLALTGLALVGHSQTQTETEEKWSPDPAMTATNILGPDTVCAGGSAGYSCTGTDSDTKQTRTRSRQWEDCPPPGDWGPWSDWSDWSSSEVGDGVQVTGWSASAGSITAGGSFTAPAAGGQTVTITATLDDDTPAVEPPATGSRDDASVQKTKQITVIKVKITPDSHTTPCADVSDVSFGLTADSYAPGGVTWKINPSVKNGATISGNGDVSVGCVGGSYTIKATSKDNPNCFDTASLEVYFGADITDFDACGNRQTRPCWIPEDHVDGCTRIPDPNIWTDSCNRHDACYSRCNNTKSACDVALRTDMYADCAAAWPNNPVRRAVCRRTALEVWRILSVVPAELYYEPAQIEGCVCCD